MYYWRENFKVTEGKGTALSLCSLSVQPRLSSLSLLGAPLGELGCGSTNALFEPQPAAFSWECLAQPHQSHKGTLQTKLLFKDRSDSV